ncbi:glycosyltransferase [Cohnella sp. OV330]|uniref:glycosyltransferase n=1 Tax=Cohnella sp. OV330 TaxID=1855288 RepID=UPI001314089E|nr:glycosyltransferase [Cohnella sp. OV330]
MMGRVSVIMTSYNKPEYVGKAIQVVLDQTHADWELLLMDDHSDEATTRVIAPYLNDSRIRYVRSAPLSIEERASAVRYAVSINEAIGMATGDYLTSNQLFHKACCSRFVRVRLSPRNRRWYRTAGTWRTG